jgi:hypothetical protein
LSQSVGLNLCCQGPLSLVMLCLLLLYPLSLQYACSIRPWCHDVLISSRVAVHTVCLFISFKLCRVLLIPVVPYSVTFVVSPAVFGYVVSVPAVFSYVVSVRAVFSYVAYVPALFSYVVFVLAVFSSVVSVPAVFSYVVSYLHLQYSAMLCRICCFRLWCICTCFIQLHSVCICCIQSCCVYFRKSSHAMMIPLVSIHTIFIASVFSYSVSYPSVSSCTVSLCWQKRLTLYLFL